MRVRAVPTVDVLDVEEDGERVLLFEGRALVLSPVASVVHSLLSTSEDRAVADLVAELAELVPMPPDPEAAVGALLADLADQGVVRVTANG